MIDERLINSDATDLKGLHQVMMEQPNSEKLCDIDMVDIAIGSGVAMKVSDAVKKLTVGKRVLMVSDPVVILDKEQRPVKERIKKVLEKNYQVEWLVIDEPDGSIVHCTPENAARIQEHLNNADCVVGVGSGTICDLCKYATYYADKDNSKPLIIIQTALSVNAFSDNASVMLISGVKRTVHSIYPKILLIDLDIVAAAPPEMNVSGYGDLIATWTAPVDWYLANVMGMNSGFHSAPSDMIRTQCKRLLENSEKLATGDEKVLADLANVLTLSGISMGLANESAPASGSEHVMSHLVDMASKIRKTGICYHGTQVAVSGIISSLLWDYLLKEFDPSKVDIASCYPDADGMKKKVFEAFDWLDEDHKAANECWSDYSKKLATWEANKDRLKAFLDNFDEFKSKVSGWVQDPAYIASSMHKAKAPCRYSKLNFPVDAKTARWAITNCHLMRNRFSVIDLLHYTGVWNEKFVEMIISRADALDAGL
ncbi:MAG: iron-containing alcohol dehydrogenase [Anaerovibrio sp.]|uniref:iron-containing alcohol dehydrogenase n=1 Tax=Anaerovibrio sp. TaxID=1872532 RepID=UPI0025E0B0B6|nr:iron-containing alcohol dehydrogenase [Anaerovibrio sp.]MCR5176003.1 iron-containing alcohol dehydrogenase [Anaerovibrio sp.]